MRLSFYTYSYTDRLKLPVPSTFERIAQTGYSALDVSGTFGNSEDPKSITPDRRRLELETAKKWKLKIDAVITHAELTTTLFSPGAKPLDLKGSIDLAVDLGCPVVTFHMGGYPKGVHPHDVWKKTCEFIRDAALHGAMKHVVLAVDGIWPPWINSTPDLMEKMFRDVASPNFGINYDPCYLVLMGIDPVAFCHRFKKQIVHAHLKDYTGKYPQWTHRIPGQGNMNYVPIFKAMRDIGFRGAAAVECFTDMKFEVACDQGFAAMSVAAKKAGVKLEKRGDS